MLLTWIFIVLFNGQYLQVGPISSPDGKSKAACVALRDQFVQEGATLVLDCTQSVPYAAPTPTPPLPACGPGVAPPCNPFGQ